VLHGADGVPEQFAYGESATPLVDELSELSNVKTSSGVGTAAVAGVEKPRRDTKDIARTSKKEKKEFLLSNLIFMS
jgi:hypothetical protein